MLFLFFCFVLYSCGQFYSSQLTPISYVIQGNFVTATENLGHSFNLCRKGESVCWFKTYQKFATTSLAPILNGTITVLDGPWYVDIKDSTASGGTSGYLKKTISIVNTTYAYYPVTNSSYSVESVVANWSACTPGTPKSTITVGKSPTGLTFSMVVSLDDSSGGKFTSEQVATLKTQLAAAYGVPANMIAITAQVSGRRGLMNANMKITVFAFASTLATTRVTVATKNWALKAGTASLSLTTGGSAVPFVGVTIVTENTDMAKNMMVS
jgi:hypothetical protein